MFGIHLVYAQYIKMTIFLTMTEHVWSGFTYFGVFAVKKLVYELFYDFTGMFNTRGYKKWLFLTGIQLVYGMMVCI